MKLETNPKLICPFYELHSVCVTLTVSAVESFIALWTSRAVLFHNSLFD